MHLDCILRYNFECRFSKQQAKAWSENKNVNENENKGLTWKRKWKGEEKKNDGIFGLNSITNCSRLVEHIARIEYEGQSLNIADKTSRWAVYFSAVSCISFFFVASNIQFFFSSGKSNRIYSVEAKYFIWIANSYRVERAHKVKCDPNNSDVMRCAYFLRSTDILINW